MSTQFTTSTDGTRIAYDVTGQGPALVLLHGAGKTRQDWHKLGYVERLQPDFTVITVDLRGVGESDPLYEVEHYAIERICQDVAAVAAACGTPRYALWGYSLGGNVARYLGAWTDQVTACAIVGVGFGPAVDEAFDRYVDTFVQQWEPLARDYREGRRAGPVKRAKVKDQIPALVACFQAMRRWPSIEPEEMRCPTMLLLGTKNKAAMGWVQGNQEALQQAQVQVEVVEGLDHPQELSHVERVFPAVRAFFS